MASVGLAEMPAAAWAATGGFVQANLVTDNQTILTGDSTLSNHTAASRTDTSLINPWGLADSPSGPFWVSENGSGKAAMYDGSGVPQAPAVTIPVASGVGATSPAPPSGVAVNSSGSFGGAPVVFVTEDGTIATWSSGTTAIVRVDNSNFTATGPVYKGVAIANNGTVNRLYVTNFRSGTVDVFDSSFAPTTTPGGFVDPAIPAGYAPFGITHIGNVLYVTYAQQNPSKHDPLLGAGKGYLAAFDPDGHLIGNLASGGELNAPWGVVLAPPGFGSFAGDLLVGNFGDGTIHAFDQAGNLVGTLTDSTSQTPVTIEGLWGLAFGNASSGNPARLYFTAGINSEADGLFGSLTPAGPAAAVSPTSLDFGSDPIGSSTASQTATLTSTGVTDLKVFGVDIQGADKGDFEVISDGCSGQDVPFQTSCAVTVRFNPSATGARAATLRFLDDAGDSPQTVTLSGAGVLPGATTRPSLSGVGQSHRRWRAGRALPHIAKVPRPPIGTTFHFKVSEPAAMRFAFIQTLPGRRVGRRCVAETAKNRHNPPCTRSVSRGSFAFTAGAGAHRVRFQGRTSKTHKLKPGHYRLIITATNTAGHASAKLTFTIVS